MNTLPRHRFATLAATLLAGAFVCSAAKAQDVNVQLRLITPHIRLPGHLVLPLPPLIVPRVVVSQPEPVWQAPSPPPPPRREWGYREPTRWDVDGDGIPNRYDRVYNPRWDRDGDGVPNRYDPTPYGGRGWHDRRESRDDRRDYWRGEWRGEWQDGRRDGWSETRPQERPDYRRDDRRNDRRDDYQRGRHD
jgi:hypothetical protein